MLISVRGKHSHGCRHRSKHLPRRAVPCATLRSVAARQRGCDTIKVMLSYVLCTQNPKCFFVVTPLCFQTSRRSSFHKASYQKTSHTTRPVAWLHSSHKLQVQSRSASWRPTTPRGDSHITNCLPRADISRAATVSPAGAYTQSRRSTAGEHVQNYKFTSSDGGPKLYAVDAALPAHLRPRNAAGGAASALSACVLDSQDKIRLAGPARRGQPPRKEQLCRRPVALLLS